ncbi:MAG: hypothetical protein IK095_05170 [Oscillospiraceae bacterium]|nr:hypothetical protein [Oscillospiraceae bacterium]
MQIKIVKVYLSGSKRIRELYEENERKEARLREMRTAVRAQDRQMKGYGRDFELILRRIEELKAQRDAVTEDRDSWIKKCKASEEARKSLAEKLERALQRLEQTGGAEA